MKKILFIVLVPMLFLLGGCYDRDVIDFKPGVSLPAVTNLASTVSGPNVSLSWTIPSGIPSEIAVPLSVNIQIYRGSILVRTVNLENEPTSFSYAMEEPSQQHRFIVKLRGRTKERLKEYSSDIYSLGQTVTVN